MSSNTTPPRRLITAEDLFRFRLPADPQLSPDGSRIVYVVQWTDLEENQYFTNLHVIGTDGSGARQFTRGNHRDSNPRWSPDGTRLAFLSDRSDRSQLWCIPVDGGEAEALTDLEEGSIGEFHWSPDGTRIAFTFRPKPEWARKSAREEREKQHRCPPPLVVRRLHYREEGGGYIGDERRHVFVLDLATRKVRQLTSGETDQDSLAWSPCGEWLAFITNRSADPDVTPYLDEIRIVPAAGGEERRVEAPEGPKHHLIWSPDGERLAYYGHTDTRDPWSACDPHLWVVGVSGGRAQDLSAALDRPAGNCTLADLRPCVEGWTGPVWHPDGLSLYFLASDRGAVHVYHATLDGGAPVNLTPGLRADVTSFSLDPEARQLAAVVGDPVHPGDVYTAFLDPGPLSLRRLTSLNQDLLAELELAVPEEIHAPSGSGSVHGWMLHPPTRREGERSPLILYIHGGPHTQYGWAMMHELQLLAAQGFAVLYTNPRGSRGYGFDHANAIRGNWGGVDYEDVMAAVDYAVQFPEIDAERLGVTGGSYGGYLTNWIIGHTDRFRCAVTQRSVVSFHSMAGTCDFNFSESDYFGGNTWDEPERLLAQSPLTYVKAVRTPLLILHSEGDLRCPIEQAEQLFAALKRLGKEVEFVRYPREANHGLSRSGPPDLRRDRLERIVGWMRRRLLEAP